MILDISCSMTIALNCCSKTRTAAVATMMLRNHNEIMLLHLFDEKDWVLEDPYLQQRINTITIFMRLKEPLTGKNVVASNKMIGSLFSEAIYLQMLLISEVNSIITLSHLEIDGDKSSLFFMTISP